MMIKCLKRIISAICCIALLFCFAPSLIADASIKESAADGKDYKKLLALGIIKESDRLGAEVYLTRGNLIKIALRMTCCDDNFGVGLITNPFTDMNEQELFYNEALSAYASGLISGGAVRTADYATGNEAAKILVSVLGYGEIAEKNGGYPNGYTAIAARLKIFPEETKNGILMTDFMKLVMKVIELDMLQIESINLKEDGIAFAKRSGESLLTNVLKIYSSEGILQADKVTDIYGKKVSDADTVIIDGEQLSAKNVDTSGLLGTCIEFYYKEIANVKELVYIGIKENKNRIDTVDFRDVFDVSSDGMSFSFNQSGGRVKNVKAKRNTAFVYNFEQMAPSFDLLSFEKKVGTKTKTLPGTVKLIDNDCDGEYEVINIVAYNTMRIDRISLIDRIVSDISGNSLELDDENDDYSISIIREGEKAAFSDLQTGDVILYACSYGNDENYIEVKARSTVVSGTLECIDEDSVTVDGKTYNIYNEVKEKMKTGSYGSFYLNARDEICDFDEVFEMVYGYLRAVGTKPGISSKPVFQIFTEYGRWVELEFADNATVNGKKTSRKEISDNICNGVYAVNELISYSVNTDGQINKLRTPKKVTEHWSEDEMEMIDEQLFRISYELENQKYRQGSSSFEDNFIIDGKTKLFFIPGDSNADKEDCYIGSTSYIVPDKEYKKVRAYNVAENGIAEVVVVDGGELKDTDSSSLLIVGGIAASRIASGEMCDALSLFYGSERINIPIKDDYSITGSDTVKRGDIVQIAVDNNSGKITKITKRYDSELGYEQKQLIGAAYASPSYVMGQIRYADDKKSTIVLDYGSKIGVLSAKTCKVYIYDTRNNEVESGSISDLQASKYCIIRAVYLQAKECIVFK